MTVLASSFTPAAGQVVTGVLGFLVVAGMGVALFFLLRSMNKHLRRVVREPRWREEREDRGEDDERGEDEPRGAGDPQHRPEPGYSRNGSGQANPSAR